MESGYLVRHIRRDQGMNKFRQVRIIILTVIGGLLVAGCFPSQTHSGADLSKLDDFKIEKNKTTEKELVDHFGAPGNTTMRGDGSKMLSWNDARSDANYNGAAFIPIVGAFTGPMVDQKINHRSLSATVRDGVVIDFTETNGNQQLQY